MVTSPNFLFPLPPGDMWALTPGCGEHSEGIWPPEKSQGSWKNCVRPHEINMLDVKFETVLDLVFSHLIFWPGPYQIPENYEEESAWPFYQKLILNSVMFDKMKRRRESRSFQLCCAVCWLAHSLYQLLFIICLWWLVALCGVQMIKHLSYDPLVLNLLCSIL